MMLASLPTPETRTALLSSDGHPDGRVTLHEYVRSEAVELERYPRKGIAFVFRCTETGAERRWGCE